jgi:vitamin B12 transporter
MSRIRFAVLALVTLPAVSWQAFAQSGQPDQPDQADTLDEVVVVATRSPTPLDKVGNSVTVLDQQAIQSSQAVSLPDLLATTPSITFNSNGGPGSYTSINIRGADSDQTMVLIDGVQLNDPASNTGGLDFGSLLAGDIARIEVLRGAQSTLYGSEAIGGVINVITAEPTAGLHGDVQTEYGSLGTSLTKGGVGGKFDRWSFRLAGGYYTTDSVSAFDSRYGGTETDPDHNAFFSGRANVDIAPAVQLDLRAYYTHSLVDTDGYPPPDYVFADQAGFETVHQFVDYSGLNFDLAGGRLKNRIDYQYTLTDRADYLNTEPLIVQSDAYSGANGRFEYQGTWAIVDGYRLVFGAQQERSWMNSSPYAPAHADTADNSEYAQLQATPAKGLTITGGERHDHYDTFGQHYTGQVAVAYALPSSTVLRASWAQGYKGPSLYQLYSPYGNTALHPEASVGGDVGVEQHLWDNRLMLSATYFITHFQHLIEFLNCPGSPLCSATFGTSGGYYDNLDKAKADGVELQAAVSVTRDLQLSANYSHIRTLDETPGSPTYGMQAYQRPQDAANASISYTWPNRLNTTVAARFSGYSTSEDFNTGQLVHLGGYTLLNLRVSYPLLDQLELYGRIDNLTDKWYETVYQFGTWGRTAFVGVRAKL